MNDSCVWAASQPPHATRHKRRLSSLVVVINVAAIARFLRTARVGEVHVVVAGGRGRVLEDELGDGGGVAGGRRADGVHAQELCVAVWSPVGLQVVQSGIHLFIR